MNSVFYGAVISQQFEKIGTTDFSNIVITTNIKGVDDPFEVLCFGFTGKKIFSPGTVVKITGNWVDRSMCEFLHIEEINFEINERQEVLLPENAVFFVGYCTGHRSEAMTDSMIHTIKGTYWSKKKKKNENFLVAVLVPQKRNFYCAANALINVFGHVVNYDEAGSGALFVQIFTIETINIGNNQKAEKRTPIKICKRKIDNTTPMEIQN